MRHVTQSAYSCGLCRVAAPSCSDSLQNGDETGVDCGGSCLVCITCQQQGFWQGSNFNYNNVILPLYTFVNKDPVPTYSTINGIRLHWIDGAPWAAGSLRLKIMAPSPTAPGQYIVRHEQRLPGPTTGLFMYLSINPPVVVNAGEYWGVHSSNKNLGGLVAYSAQQGGGAPPGVDFKQFAGAAAVGQTYSLTTMSATYSWDSAVDVCSMQYTHLCEVNNGGCGPNEVCTMLLGFPDPLCSPCPSTCYVNGVCGASSACAGSPPDPINGSFDTACGPEWCGGTCPLVCDPGYAPSSPSAVCNVITGWDTTLVCTGIPCDPLTNPANGGVSISNQSQFPSIASFTCDSGYSLAGVSTQTCQTDGTWDAPPPTCDPDPCLSAPAATFFGTFDAGCAGSPSGTTCALTCDTGYTASADAVCTLGVWDSPTCIPDPCSSPPANPAFGTFSACANTLSGGSCALACDAGYTESAPAATCALGVWVSIPSCEPNPCPAAPAATSFGTFAVGCAGSPSGSTCALSCDAGYVASAPAATCVLGAWSLETCSLAASTCAGMPEIPSYGSFPTGTYPSGCLNTPDGLTCPLTCDTGYTPTGDAVCTAGSWDKPACLPADCQMEPAPVPNGAFAGPCSGTASGQLCILTCSPGYTPSGDAQCQLGVWATPAPDCLANPCLDPPLDPQNGVLAQPCAPALNGGTCALACDSGYTSVGGTSAVCTLGSWDVPSCQGNACGSVAGLVPYASSFSLSTCDGTPSGATCIPGVICIPGYTATQLNAVCAAGAWTTVPSCEPSPCSSQPADPAFGTFAQCNPTPHAGSCSLTADAGYTCTGAQVSCSYGQWSTTPTCAPNRCTSMPPDPPNGWFPNCLNAASGTQCSLNCDTGYHRTGVMTCSFGVWIDVPYCEGNICSSYTDPQNGFSAPVSGNGLNYPTTVEFDCDPGFFLSGPGQRVCNPSGTWSPAAVPVCLPECPAVTAPSNGSVTLSSGTPPATLQATASYVCNPGYALLGEHTATCVDIGNGPEWSSAAPTCIKVWNLSGSVEFVPLAGQSVTVELTLQAHQGEPLRTLSQTRSGPYSGPFLLDWGEYLEGQPWALRVIDDQPVNWWCRMDSSAPINGALYADVTNTRVLCQLATCNDGVQNGDEYGRDCGGTCPLACRIRAGQGYTTVGVGGLCPVGFSSFNSTTCVDVDECLNKNGGCDSKATCNNFEGSFKCGYCPSGYSGSGDKEGGCVDIDECKTVKGACPPSALCGNLDGSYKCSCATGYSALYDDKTKLLKECVDIDECAVNNGECDKLTTCTNIPGSRTCGSCPIDYIGDGESGCHTRADYWLNVKPDKLFEVFSAAAVGSGSRKCRIWPCSKYSCECPLYVKYGPSTAPNKVSAITSNGDGNSWSSLEGDGCALDATDATTQLRDVLSHELCFDQVSVPGETPAELPSDSMCADDYLKRSDTELFNQFAGAATGLGDRQCRIFPSADEKCPFYVMHGSSDIKDNGSWRAASSAWFSVVPGTNGCAAHEKEAVGMLRHALHDNLCFGYPCSPASLKVVTGRETSVIDRASGAKVALTVLCTVMVAVCAGILCVRARKHSRAAGRRAGAGVEMASV